MTQKSSILVCIDVGSGSDIALRYACYKAKKTGFSVHILAVIESSYKGLLFASRAVGKDKKMHTEEYIRDLIKKAREETGIIPTSKIREGDIATEIVNEVKEDKDCSMVILGKSSTSISDNTVLPVISRKIGNKIKVPLVVVPENMDKNYLSRLA
ncbi:universal stress protein [Rickettsiales bacterium]|nr:universal stress protein [Rickettsiales bacterium]